MKLSTYVIGLTESYHKRLAYTEDKKIITIKINKLLKVGNGPDTAPEYVKDYVPVNQYME